MHILDSFCQPHSDTRFDINVIYLHYKLFLRISGNTIFKACIPGRGSTAIFLLRRVKAHKCISVVFSQA